MSDNVEDLPIGADITPFRRAMQQLKGSGEDAAKTGKGSFDNLSGPFKGLQESLLLVVAGVAAFTAGMHETITATAEMTDEAISLGRAFGIGATAAGVWARQTQNVNATSQEFESAAAGLTERLKEQEQRLNAMGLVTRDSAGELRNFSDLMADGIEVVNSYKAGTDRNLAANTIFGEALKGNSELLRITQADIKATAERMQELGLIVTEENVTAYREFQAAGDDVSMVMDGLKKTVGEILMPVLTEMSSWFSAVAPAAITVVKGAVGGLVTAFWALQNGVIAVWETVNAFVYSVAEPLIAVSNSISLAMQGEFDAAGDRIMGVSDRVAAQWKGAFDRIADNSREASEKIRNIWMQGAPDLPAPTEGRSFKNPTQTQPKAEPSKMGDYRARLEAIATTYAMENELREFSKAQELAYWRELAEAAGVSAKDREQIARTIAKLELEIARDKAAQLSQIDKLRNDAARTDALVQIDEAQRIAEHQVRMGQMTEQELFAVKAQFIAQREAIELAYLNRKIAAAQADPDSNPALLEQLELQKLEIRRRYAQQQGEVVRQSAEESSGALGNIFGGLEGQLTRLGTTMLTSWQSTASALKGIFTSIGQNIIQEMITKPLMEKITAWATERGLIMAGIGGKAADAGAGAASAMASIPYVGPILALAAMASVMAAVGGLAGSVPSAAGGYDIPKGINPMTQLHEEEMVLPAKLANAVRGMAGAEGEGAAQPGPVSFSVTAMDARSVRRLFEDHGSVLADVLRQQARDYAKG